ncbi:hypothetical protein AVEN_87573-1, partial [Araneus ventricosus]
MKRCRDLSWEEKVKLTKAFEEDQLTYWARKKPCPNIIASFLLCRAHNRKERLLEQKELIHTAN